MAAEPPSRVAILPMRPDVADLTLKKDGEIVADYLFGGLADLPGIEWVERGQLKDLLSESELALASAGGDSIRFAKLLKADILVRGSLSEPRRTADERVFEYSRSATLEVVDLTNAETLASRQITWKIPKPGTPIEQERLVEIGSAARSLLQEALKRRAQNANRIAIAPVFFANAGASPRLDAREGNFLDDLSQAATSQPRVKILRFQGATEARGEQRLALLGLSDGDPAAWQKAADGYIWGSYRELPSKKTTAFEDIEVEAEIFLWTGGNITQRFARTFPVGEFPKVSQELAKEIVGAAARTGRTANTQESGKIVAGLMLSRLEQMANADAAQDKRSLPEKLNRAPFRAQKLDYGRRLLELVCFFDPESASHQILRLRVQRLRSSFPPPHNSDQPRTEALPNECVADLSDYLDQIKRLCQQAPLPVAEIAECLADVMSGSGNSGGPPNWHGSVVAKADPEISKPMRLHEEASKQLRRRILEILTVEAPMAISALPEKSDGTRVPPAEAIRWIYTALSFKEDPHLKLEMLKKLWPAIPADQRASTLSFAQGPLVRELAKLMEELGDRTAVQAALGENKQAPVEKGRPFPFPPSMANTPDTFLPGVEKRDPPPIDEFRLPIDGFFKNEPHFRGHQDVSISALDQFGDLVLVEFDQRAPFRRMGSPIRFRPSTGLVNLLPSQMLGPVIRGRMYYPAGEKINWFDILTGETGSLTLESGLPIANPTMIGKAGERYLVVAGERQAAIVGLYDVTTRRWLTPPSPPAPAQPMRPGMAMYTRGSIVGTEEWIYFPLWNFFYSTRTQQWHQPPFDLSSRGMSPFDDVSSRALTTDREFWIWSETGIVHYWPERQQVLWQAETQGLSAVCADGPYLLMSFLTPREEKNAMPRGLTKFKFSPGTMRCTLLLFDRAGHEKLRAFDVPFAITSILPFPDKLWFGVNYGMGADAGLRENGEEKIGLISLSRSAAITTLGGVPTRLPILAQPIQQPPGLYEAILRSDLPTLRTLLARGVNAKIDTDYTPPLLLAAATGDTEVVRLMLSKGAKVDESPQVKVRNPREPTKSIPEDFVTTGRTALHIAAARGDREMIRILLDAGANANAQDNTGSTPLYEALTSEDAHSIEALVGAGAFVQSGTKAKDPVAWLDRRRNPELAKQLLALQPKLSPDQTKVLQRVADPNASAADDPTLAEDFPALLKEIDRAAAAKREDEVIALIALITAGKAKDPLAAELLSALVSKGMTKAVAALLDRGADPEMIKPRSHEKPPVLLNRALTTNQVEIARLLMERGANPRPLDKNWELFAERTIVCQPKNNLLVPALLHYDNLSAPHGYGTVGGTLLCAAALEGNMEAVEYLLARGVSPSEKGRLGLTPLHSAVIKFAYLKTQIRIACLLADRGADLTARDLADRTIFDTGYLGAGNVAAFLTRLENESPQSEAETRGRDILLAKLRDVPDYETLQAAVETGSAAEVQALLERGAPVAPGPKNRMKPGLVFIATARPDREIVRLLLEHGANPNIPEAGLRGNVTYNSFGNGIPGTGEKPSGYSKTPLIVAAESGDSEIIWLLLSRGAYAPAEDLTRRNALDSAKDEATGALIRELAGAQFAAEKVFKLTDQWATGDARKAIDRQVQAAILADPRILHVRNQVDKTLWSHLKEKNFLTAQTYQFLAGKGFAVDFRNEFGLSPLHIAVLGGEASTSNFAQLLSYGFDPSYPDSRGLTAIDLAKRIVIKEDRAEILEALTAPRSR